MRCEEKGEDKEETKTISDVRRKERVKKRL